MMKTKTKMTIKQILIGAILVLIGCVNFDGVAATRYNDVTIEDDGTLSCMYCFTDMGIHRPTFDSSVTGFGFLTNVKGETEDFAVIRDDAGTSCPAGRWFVLYKRANADPEEALKPLDMDTCDEVEKTTVSQNDKVLTVKQYFYSGAVRKYSFK